MKKIVFLLAALLALAGCASPPQITPSPPEETPSAESPAPSVSPSVEPSPSELPPEPEQPSWPEAYADALLDGQFEKPDWAFFDISEARGYRLIDLDFDGIPELLLNYLGTVNVPVYAGFTYRGGQAQPFWFDGAEELPVYFALYRNLDTGGLQWVSHSDYRSGAGTYYYYHDYYDFSNLLQPEATAFCAYKVELTGDGEEGEAERYYAVTGGEETPSDYETIMRAYDEVMESFSYLYAQEISVWRNDLCVEDDSLDRLKLSDFFERWDSAAQPPRSNISPEELAAIGKIETDYFLLYSTNPVNMASHSSFLPDIAAIRGGVITYYAENGLDACNSFGIPEGLSSIKIYSLSGADTLWVIAGNEAFGQPQCRLFTYAEGALAPCNDPDVFYEKGAAADAMRIVYTDEDEYPRLELDTYFEGVPENGGDCYIYRIDGDTLTYITKEAIGGNP